MGIEFTKVMDCKKCNKQLSYFKPIDGDYYKCVVCNDVIIAE